MKIIVSCSLAVDRKNINAQYNVAKAAIEQTLMT